MFKPNPYYRDCASLGKGLPKEVSTPSSVIFIYNDWFLDEIGSEHPTTDEDIEDKLIAKIDGDDEEASEMSVSGYPVQDFDMYKLIANTLNARERKIFIGHYVNGESFRDLGKKLGIHYTIVFRIFNQCLKKLGTKICRKNHIPLSELNKTNGRK